MITQPPATLTTTPEVKAWAIARANDKNWLVDFLPKGMDIPQTYAALVIAWPRDIETNWCRIMTIVDGQYQTEFYQTPDGVPLATKNGFLTDNYILGKLKAFRLNWV